MKQLYSGFSQATLQCKVAFFCNVEILAGDRECVRFAGMRGWIGAVRPRLFSLETGWCPCYD